MTTLLRAGIPAMLEIGINKIHGNYKARPKEYNEYYETSKSFKAEERDQEMVLPGLPGIKNEGQPGTMGSMGQGYTSRYFHKTLEHSISITQEAIQDNQYKDQFKFQGDAMLTGFLTAENMLAASVLNNAFNPTHVGGDGQPLCSAFHPTQAGTCPNRFGAGVAGATVAFSMAGLQAAVNGIESFTAANGVQEIVRAQKLLIPKERKYEASRFLNSTFAPENANNAINPINHDNYFPKGYKVLHFLDSPTSWFVLTDALVGLRRFERMALKNRPYVEPSTGNLVNTSTMRLSYGWTNYRCIWGSPGV